MNKSPARSLLFRLGNFRAMPFPLSVLFLFVVGSVILSTSIFLRFQFPFDLTKWANMTGYFFAYCFVPSIAFFWLLDALLPQFKGQSKRFKVARALAFYVVFIFYLLIIIPPIIGSPSFVFGYWRVFVPEYLFFWIPIPAMLLVYSKRATKAIGSRKTVATFLIVAVLLPNLAVLTCLSAKLSEVSSIPSDSGRVSAISQLVYDTTLTTSFLRAQNDFWKFLMIGTGKCGEMSTSTLSCLDRLGVESKEVVLPGEDHEFVEVELNGSRWVVDPGYYPGQIITRQERATRRINEIGAISYVAAYVGSSFVELTQDYVPTDTIIIRITLDGEPLANERVSLEHLFMGNECSLPPFYTDANGTVTLHLGAMNYKDSAKQYESYYWIFANGKDTGFKATSSGSGQVRIIDIELSGAR